MPDLNLNSNKRCGGAYEGNNVIIIANTTPTATPTAAAALVGCGWDAVHAAVAASAADPAVSGCHESHPGYSVEGQWQCMQCMWLSVAIMRRRKHKDQVRLGNVTQRRRVTESFQVPARAAGVFVAVVQEISLFIKPAGSLHASGSSSSSSSSSSSGSSSSSSRITEASRLPLLLRVDGTTRSARHFRREFAFGGATWGDDAAHVVLLDLSNGEQGAT